MRFANKPEDEREDHTDIGMKEIGQIFQDMDHPMAPIYLLMGDELWIIDPEVMRERLLKHNAFHGTIQQMRDEGRMP